MAVIILRKLIRSSPVTDNPALRLSAFFNHLCLNFIVQLSAVTQIHPFLHAERLSHFNVSDFHNLKTSEYQPAYCFF
ncbi:hypothetical protein C3408_13545 [Candidatus Pantoea alvi]|nr:hypothetical protein C3408_13545 [Pantoea alvi]